uniref:ATP synthase subunit 8 n=1 Tax=Leptopilina boulardi TaxID=63433 RepID=A0A1L3MYB4_9HYME|nr:ATP synthase subunit 8 [Leptopilina boulardi]
MPQMKPMNWLYLLFYMILVVVSYLIMVSYMTLIYFFKKDKKVKNSFEWKMKW